MLQYVFEGWISAVWNTGGDFLATFEEDSILTTSQLIIWLKKQDCWDWRLAKTDPITYVPVAIVAFRSLSRI